MSAGTGKRRSGQRPQCHPEAAEECSGRCR